MDVSITFLTKRKSWREELDGIFILKDAKLQLYEENYCSTILTLKDHFTWDRVWSRFQAICRRSLLCESEGAIPLRFYGGSPITVSMENPFSLLVVDTYKYDRFLTRTYVYRLYRRFLRISRIIHICGEKKDYFQSTFFEVLKSFILYIICLMSYFFT